jgi:serine/threonine protein kinase
MTSDTSVNDLLEAALDLPPADREAFLRTQCGPGEPLLATALRLLRVIGNMDDFLPTPVIASAELQPGDVLGERFTIIRKIGEGGMGSVFLADDALLGEVALKTVRPDLQHDRNGIEQLRAELRMARSISHPNVCPVFELFTFRKEGRGREIVAFTMRYLPGETLADRLARGQMSVSEAQEIAGGIAAGIDALHAEDIIHRDLKPANIILTTGHHEPVRPVIADFGLAKSELANTTSVQTGRSQVFGSPDYMAPEQFRNVPASKAADIYAFGLILFEMLTGHRPFPAEDVLATAIRRSTEDAPPVAGDWKPSIARALSRIPEQRPGSAAAVIPVLHAGQNRECCIRRRRSTRPQ